MEQYKEKLKLQNTILGLCCLVLAVFFFLGIAGEMGLVSFMTPAAGDSHWQSQWRGFVSGASFGVLALMVFGLVRNIRALKDEKKLKKLYVAENDERQILIYTHALRSAMQVCLILGLVAIIVAGYFSATVSMTLLICVLLTSVLCMLFKLYYSKKF